MRPALLRRAVAERFAAFALVFAGCGAIITNAIHNGLLGSVGVSLVFGLVIMAMIRRAGFGNQAAALATAGLRE